MPICWVRFPPQLTGLLQELHARLGLQAKSATSPEYTWASSYSINSGSVFTAVGSAVGDTASDDSDTGGNQQRIQFKTSQYASELNWGHLIHSADNFRSNDRFG